MIIHTADKVKLDLSDAEYKSRGWIPAEDWEDKSPAFRYALEYLTNSKNETPFSQAALLRRLVSQVPSKKYPADYGTVLVGVVPTFHLRIEATTGDA